MAEKEELFKTTWKGGYDKDDVLQAFQTLKDDIYQEQHSFRNNIEQMDRDIAAKRARLEELEKRIVSCDAELAELQSNVRDNYQTYIDSYDAIGSQIFESRVYSDKVQKEAQEEKAKLLEEALDAAAKIREDALADAARTREEAKAESEKMIADAKRVNEIQADIGRQKYEAVQQELHMVLGDFNQVQRKFMQAYKSIHDVLNDNSGDLARLRLDVLRAESPTTRIPSIQEILREAETEGIEIKDAEEAEDADGVPEEDMPTKDLSEVQEAVAEETP